MRGFKFSSTTSAHQLNIPLAAMSSQTDFLSEILKKAEGLKVFLQEKNSLPVEDFTPAPLHITSVSLPIPPLQLPSADSILSNFRSLLPAELLDRCVSTLIESAEAAQRNYEMTYRALYSSTQPIQQDRKAHKLRNACEQLYRRTITSFMQNLLNLARQRATSVNAEIRDPCDPKLRTRFRQVWDKTVFYGLSLLISSRNTFPSLNSVSSQTHIHLTLKEPTLLARQKCPNVKLKFGLANFVLDLRLAY